MSKKAKYLFQSPEAAKLWDMADDASIGTITMGDLYPHLFMPDDIANIKVEQLILHVFKDKDREKAQKWLNDNASNLD